MRRAAPRPGQSESKRQDDELRLTAPDRSSRAPGVRATAVAMFNLVSLIIGFVALISALIAFIPLLGWANWLIIPLAIIGAVIGMMSRGTAGRNLNLFVIIIGVIRLTLGGGIL